MKLTSTIEKVVNKKETYPCLKVALPENEGNGEIVLFISKNIGTVVNTGNSGYSLGYTTSTWRSSCFEPFYGSVTLNSK